ncbi:MAG: hypothetical protein HFE85_03100 [Clostridiales bacterium]|nr:hypothetical protein [Clostridiales bacterium]
MKKKNFRLPVLLITLVMLFTQIGIPVTAAEKTTSPSALISLGDATAKPGQTFTIPVTLEKNPGISSMLLQISYDSSVFQLTNATDEAMFSGFTPSQSYDKNPYNLLYDEAANCTETGALSYLTFTVLDDAAAGDYSIKITYVDGCNQTLDTVNAEVTDGTVSVTEKTPPVTVQACDAAGTAVTSVPRDDYFTVTVTTPGDVTNVRLVNEYGLSVTRKSYQMKNNPDGTKSFIFQTSIGTTGQGRQLTVYTQKAGDYFHPTSAVLTLDVTCAPRVSEASIEKAAFINTPITLTAVTNKNVNRLIVKNEYGLTMGTRNQIYRDTPGGRVWTLQIEIGTRGERIFFVSGKNQYGDLSDPVQTNVISVRAY